MDINDLFGPIAANDNDKRSCPACGDPVVGQRDKVYCSRPCKRHASDQRNREQGEARRLLASAERICAWCDGPYKSVDREVLCCSRACGAKKAAQTQAVKRPPKTASYTIYKPLCDECGVRFTATSVKSRLCSPECSASDARKQALRHSIANDNRDR